MDKKKMHIVGKLPKRFNYFGFGSMMDGPDLSALQTFVSSPTASTPTTTFSGNGGFDLSSFQGNNLYGIKSNQPQGPAINVPMQMQETQTNLTGWQKFSNKVHDGVNQFKDAGGPGPLGKINKSISNAQNSIYNAVMTGRSQAGSTTQAIQEQKEKNAQNRNGFSQNRKALNLDTSRGLKDQALQNAQSSGLDQTGNIVSSISRLVRENKDANRPSLSTRIGLMAAYGGPLNKFADGGDIMGKVTSGVDTVTALTGNAFEQAQLTEDVQALKEGVDASQFGEQNGDDWDSLATDINSYNSLNHVTKKDLRNKSWGEDIGNIYQSGSQGAEGGFKTGGVWGAVAGGALGLISSAIGIGIGRSKARKEANRLNDKIDYTNAFNDRMLAMRGENIKQNQLNNQLTQYAAFGGNLRTNGTNFSNGLEYINNGDSHEMNPYGGVFMGTDEQGIPNMVEEGEVIYDDYVFSNRLKVPEKFKKKYHLNGKSLSFSDAAKKIGNDSEERPNDPISNSTLDIIMKNLMGEQEEVRNKLSDKDLKKNMFEEGGPFKGRTFQPFLWKTKDNPQGKQTESTEENEKARAAILKQHPKILKKIEEKAKEYGVSPKSIILALAREGFVDNLKDKSFVDNIYSPKPKDSISGAMNAGLDFFFDRLQKGEVKLNRDIKVRPESEEELAQYRRKGIKGAAFENLDDLIEATAAEVASYQKAVTDTYKGLSDEEIYYLTRGFYNRGDNAAVDYENNNWNVKASYDDYGAYDNLFGNDSQVTEPTSSQSAANYEDFLNGLLTAKEPSVSVDNTYMAPKVQRYAFVSEDDEQTQQEGQSDKSQAENENQENNKRQESGIFSNNVDINPMNPGIPGLNLDIIRRHQEDNENNEQNVHRRPTWMRSAPLYANGIAALMGAFEKPMNGYAEDIIAAASGKPSTIGPNPIGNYLTYIPSDINATINDINANAAANRRALLANAGLNRGAATAALLASDYNTLRSIGEARRQAEMANFERKSKVGEFNRGTDMFNAQQSLQAQMSNQHARQQDKAMKVHTTAQAANMKNNNRILNEQQKSQNLNNFMKSLAELGKENEYYNFRDAMMLQNDLSDEQRQLLGLDGAGNNYVADTILPYVSIIDAFRDLDAKRKRKKEIKDLLKNKEK